MKFKRKPVTEIVEAKQLTDQTMWEIVYWLNDNLSNWYWGPLFTASGNRIIFYNSVGDRKASKGDWIVLNKDGEFDSYAPEHFQIMFEPYVEDFNPDDFLQELDVPLHSMSFPMPKSLTDDEINECTKWTDNAPRQKTDHPKPWRYHFARAIEKALMEKNL